MLLLLLLFERIVCVCVFFLVRLYSILICHSFRCVPLLYGCVVVAFANSDMMIVYITGQSVGASDSKT